MDSYNELLTKQLLSFIAYFTNEPDDTQTNQCLPRDASVSTMQDGRMISALVAHYSFFPLRAGLQGVHCTGCRPHRYHSTSHFLVCVQVVQGRTSGGSFDIVSVA
eukprot:scaffold3156_cov268-Chaetoceros_neogracile.AAC.4